MFVYDNISSLKSNIDAELFILENQINSTNQREDEVYKGFINLPINDEVNLTNALILNDFNEAFASTSQMLEELREQKEKLEAIKNFVSEVDDSQDLNDNAFQSELQNLLTDYYSFRNEVQAKYITEDKNINELKQKVNKFIPIEEQPEELPQDTEKIQSEDVLLEQEHQEKVSEIQNETDNFEDDAPQPEVKKEKLPDPFKEDTFNKSLNEIKESTKENAFEDNIFKQATDSKNKENQEEDLAPAGIPLEDNRLLFISEAQRKVYLPYYITDLQQTLLKSDYEDYDELIEKDYVLPLDKFKNPRISRFREGFKLMRKKEFESLGASLSYGLKLMNNYRLHPAVISACRTSQELNTYLDCLEDDRLNSFKIFEIQFDVPPMKT